jgi:hypothetical protein
VLLALLVGASLLFAKAAEIGPFDNPICDQLESDPGAWSGFASPNGERTGSDAVSRRQALADDAADCGTLQGKPKAWIERRLDEGSEWTGRRAGRVTYTLGPCTEKRDCLFPGDTEFLDLFYEDGEVASIDQYGT